MSKIVFIAHPMSGNIEDNTQSVINICKNIHSEEIIPFFPSFTWRKYLKDTDDDKKLAGMVNIEFFKRKTIDEVWLYGNRLTDGMKKEIVLALKYEIPVFGKTNETESALAEFLKILKAEKIEVTSIVNFKGSTYRVYGIVESINEEKQTAILKFKEANRPKFCEECGSVSELSVNGGTGEIECLSTGCGHKHGFKEWEETHLLSNLTLKPK